jgi:hypothetical protein
MPPITPGQALLSLMQKLDYDINRLQKIKNLAANGVIDARKFTRLHDLLLRNQIEQLVKLKKLYITGASNPDKCIELCNVLLDHNLFKHKELAIDEKSISDAPERRYFETHLVYRTLKNNLKNLDASELESYFNTVVALVKDGEGINIPEHGSKTIKEVINGEYVAPTFKQPINMQYSTYIKRLKNGSIFAEPNFSEAERTKILWLIKIVYMGIVNGWAEKPMPIDIYNTNPFFVDRGRVKFKDSIKRSSRTVRNQNYGLLKGHMLTLGVEDIAFSSEAFPHQKSADYFQFNDEAKYTQSCFEKLVHPYSSGISGVLLLQLRVFATLREKNTPSI